MLLIFLRLRHVAVIEFFKQKLVFYTTVIENSKSIFMPCYSSRESTSPHIFMNLAIQRLYILLISFELFPYCHFLLDTLLCYSQNYSIILLGFSDFALKL